MSDRAYKIKYEDKSDIVLKNALGKFGYKILNYRVLPDEISQLKQKIYRSCGKGETYYHYQWRDKRLESSDITPESTYKLTKIEISGINELLCRFRDRDVLPLSLAVH